MPEQTLRLGIIGTGTIAAVHATAAQLLPQVRLVAATSRREQSGREFCNRFSCDFESSVESLVARSDIDAVAITTPSGAHAECGILAAQAGKHVFCEKPIDVTLEKIDLLIETCRAHGVQLGAVFQSRMGEGAIAFKNAVEAGRFGTISQCSAYIPWYRTDEYYQSVGWRGTRALDGGGALMNQGVHAIDLLLWLAGDVEEVSARCDTRLHKTIEVEDNAVAWLRFKSGALGVIQASTCSWPGQKKRLEIMGAEGTVIMEDDAFKTWSFREAAPEDAERLAPKNASGIGGGASDPKAISNEGHRRLYEDFADAVFTGRPPRISGEEARRSVNLILAIYRSNESGKPVRVADM